MNISFGFNGTNTSGQVQNDGNFTNTMQTAFCYFPALTFDLHKYQGASGDTWLNWNNAFIKSLDYEVGSVGFALMLHEVLHGLGLKHPHDSGGTGRPTYADLDMPFIDRQWVSVMSYDLFENGGDGAYAGSMPIAPMIMDVIALQYLYGESNSDGGNTEYDLTRFSGKYYNTLWDAAGNDTLDASKLPYGVYVEMGISEASNGIRDHQIGYITTALDQLSLSVFGFNPSRWTWLWGEYENFIGSSYRDVITGNSLDNLINGGDGDDHLFGGEGNDTFDWDPDSRGGADTFEGGLGDDKYVLSSIYDTVIEHGFEGVDTVYVGFNYSIAGAAIENLSAFSNMSVGIRLDGNDWGNRLTGGLKADTLVGWAGNDMLSGLGGNDYLDGGTGIDLALFASMRAGSSIRRVALGHSITSAPDGTDSLVDIERLQFSDGSVALDLAGNAGTVAKILGAVFGPAEVSNEVYAGIGLYYIDGGMTYESLMQLALDARLGVGAGHQTIVDLLYTNVVGIPPGEADRAYFVGLLDSGEFTIPGLGVYAADYFMNQDNIDLIGLADQGFEYVPYAEG